jgi:hypothetical protein
MNNHPVGKRICAVAAGFALGLSAFADDLFALANLEDGTAARPPSKGGYTLLIPRPVPSCGR